MPSLTQVAASAVVAAPGGRAALCRASAVRNPRLAPIFMLHRVLPDLTASYEAEMAITTARFAQFLEWIDATYEVAPLTELLARLRRVEPHARPLCALTFDDGWVDTYRFAFPLWRQHRFPVTVFLALAFIGSSRHFWQERLWSGLRQAAGSARQRLSAAAAQCDWWPSIGPADLEFKRLARLLTRRSSSEAEAFVAAFCSGLPELGERAFMNWDEVQALRQAGVNFGSHTIAHTLLTHAEPADAVRELRQSRQLLSGRLGAAVTDFCYPWGKFNSFVRGQVQQAGYACAVTTRCGLARGSSDALLLPRIPISQAQLGRPDRERWDPATLLFRLGWARRNRQNGSR